MSIVTWSRKRRIITFLISGLAILCLIVTLVYQHFKFNLHTVIPGQVYRSAQPKGPQLTQLIKQKHLRAVINLRGGWPTNPWYQTEARVAREHHLKLYNLSIATHKLPQLERLRCLAKVLAIAPRPLLLHCRQGVDRTGLASALTLLLNNQTTLATIQKQVSYRYFAFSSDSVGKVVLRHYQTWLKQQHITQSSKKHFLAWLKQLTPGVNYPFVDNPKHLVNHGWTSNNPANGSTLSYCGASDLSSQPARRYLHQCDTISLLD